MDEQSSDIDPFAAARKRMVQEQLSGMAPRILAAMSKVPRHEFVPELSRSLSYEDMPLPIGYGQTIS